MITILDARNRRAMRALLPRELRTDPALSRRVRAIVDAVRTEGDRALVRFARRFDHTDPPFEVSAEQIREQAARVPNEVRRAITRASQSIARVAARQVPGMWRMRTAPGVLVEQRVVPLATVGCYVPAGRFPLPSSLLMTAVPARVAGVREIVAVCPRPDATVMCAAHEAGVTKLIRLGGAHAIAALAYGTKSVPRVDKIVGPGNRYVATAKACVAADCAIDFFAGPTEIVVVAGSGRPDWIAADLAAQAEHDPDARAILITWDRTLARRVARRLPTGVNAAMVLVGTEEDAIRVANTIAPEHLVVDRESLARRPLTAGAVFVGPYSAQAAGDYATGSNHVLPTAGAARFRGGLSAADFVRVMSVQRITKRGLEHLAPTILPLAHAEGLEAHALSIEMRLQRSPRSAKASRYNARTRPSP